MKTYLLTFCLCLLVTEFSAQQSKNLQKGIESYVKGDYRNAIYRIEKALEDDPASSECYYYLGLAKNGTNINHGLEEISKAIELKPSYALAYNARGKIYTSLYQLSNAIDDCSQAIQLDPGISMFYLDRGEAYLRSEKFNLSLQDCNKSIELDPEMTQYVLLVRAQAYTGLGNYANALIDCNQMIAMDSKLYASLHVDHQKYMIRGDVRFRMKDFKGAIEDFYLGSEPEMDGGYALFRVGEAKLALNDLKGACEAFEEASRHGIIVDEELENCK